MEDAPNQRRQRRRLIAIAAGVVGFLALGHVVPATIQARKMVKRRTCIANLKQLDGATQSWRIDEKQPLTATPGRTDLYGGNDAPGLWPICPMGGTYTIGSGVTPPTCSISGHAITINTNFFKDPRRYAKPTGSRF